MKSVDGNSKPWVEWRLTSGEFSDSMSMFVEQRRREWYCSQLREIRVTQDSVLLVKRFYDRRERNQCQWNRVKC